MSMQDNLNGTRGRCVAICYALLCERAIDVGAQCGGVVVFRVARPEDQRYASVADCTDERGNRCFLRVELFAVPARELRPARAIVVEPPPERHAWRNILEPEVDR